MTERRRAPGAGDNRTLLLDGARIRAARRAKGFSRQSLSDASKGPHSLSEATIKRAERGEPIYVSNAQRLSDLLDTPLTEWLLPGSESTQIEHSVRPLIAVMPFRDQGNDGNSFSDGLAEDLITRLSRTWFPIMHRASSLGEFSSDARATAKALGARYWVDGHIQRSANRLRVTAQLADVETGAIVGRYPYERPFSDVFSLQRTLTAAIVADLSPDLMATELRRFEHYEPKDLDAWQLGLRGAWHFYRRTASDNAQARLLLREALQKDRHMPLAWYTLALVHQQDVINQWSTRPAESVAALREVCNEFERLYPEDAGAQVACAYLDVYQSQRQSAINRLSTAIDIDPNACLAYTLYGQTLAMAREPDRGLEQFDVALRLNPKDTERWSTYIGIALAHFVAGRYAQTIAAANDAIRVRPSAAFAYSTLASAQALEGNVPEARQSLETMLHLQPSLTARGIMSVTASTEKDIGERYLEGLRIAGLSS